MFDDAKTLWPMLNYTHNFGKEIKEKKPRDVYGDFYFFFSFSPFLLLLLCVIQSHFCSLLQLVTTVCVWALKKRLCTWEDGM